MNYFASGLQDGFRTGAESYQRRKDREQQSELEKARRDLELEREIKRQRFEQSMQGERISADAKKQFNQNEFTAGENFKGRSFTGTEADKGRKHGTSERTASQGFTAEQAAADRALRQKLQDDSLNQAAKQFATTNDREYQNMGLMAGFKSRADARDADPTSMTNQLAAEKLAKLKRENSEAGAPLGTPGAPAAPAAPAAPRKALTTQDADALAWAKANPYSPTAQKILERLGVK